MKGTTMNTKTYYPVSLSAPTYWASALINNDYSGLSEEEIREVNAWIHNAKLGFPVSEEYEGLGYWNGKLTNLSIYTFLS